MAEFLRRGRPWGLAKAPSSRERSWRIGWTRMTLPSLDSWTDPATMVTSMGWRAHPAAGVAGAGEADHPGAVGQPGDRQPGGGIPGPALAAGARGCGRPDLRAAAGRGWRPPPGVQDVHQPAGDHDLDRLTGERRAEPRS